MTVEEKARAYDEAKARMRRVFNSNRCTIGFMNEIFPEINGSEDDRIREDLIQWIDDFPDSIWRGHYKKDILAWLEKHDANKEYVFRPLADTMIENAVEQALEQGDVVLAFNGFYTPVKGKTSEEILTEYDNWIEKQCEQPTDKVEPKFKVGDWIVSGKSIAQISNIQGQYYIGIDIYGNDLTLRSDKIRLWTIQDAKEGDVLANGHHILILKESIYDWSPDGTPYYVKAYCGIKPNGNFYIGKDNWCFCGTFHPATKEQRDSLFSKMKQKDYEWNDENKKLSKNNS